MAFVTYCLLASVLSLASIGHLRSAFGAEGSFNVGVASVCITPDEPVCMEGYLDRLTPFQGVWDDIHAKAMAFEDATGNRALMITADLCILRKETVEPFCEKIMQATGLKRNQILLNVSHTHTGPLTGCTEMYSLTASDRTKLAAYKTTLQQNLVDVSVNALNDLQASQISYGVGSAPDFIVNRRILDSQGAYSSMGPNYNGLIDDQIPVLRVDRPDGSLRAVLFGAACHNVALGKNLMKISGDYAGVAQNIIEAENPGVQAMFMAGCGGDANPDPRLSEAYCTQHGTSLATTVLSVLDGKLKAVEGTIQTDMVWANLPLEKSPYTYEAPMAFWQFGNDLSLVGLSGETVSEYATRVRALSSIQNPCWVAGYCNDVFGYLPSETILSEGGYESNGVFGSNWPNENRFATGVENAVIDAVDGMAQNIVTPEPSTLALLGGGFIGFMAHAWRKRRCS